MEINQNLGETRKFPSFSKPNPTECIIANKNLDQIDISVGNYQTFLRGEDFDIFDSDLSLDITEKLLLSLPENHDLFVPEGFVNKTDKDHYQVYSDTDSAYVLIKLPFSKTKDIQKTVIYCQAIAERLNKSYQKALELYFYRASNWHPEYNAMNFKSEVIAFKGFFGAKKFYGLGIIWKEGTFYEELDLKTTGGQIKKADITKVTKEMLSEIYILLCLKLEATDQKLMYNTIFRKIKNKYILKLRDAIAKMDLTYFVIPKKWSFGEKKVVPAQIVGAKLYNRIIKETISIGDSVSVLPIKFNYKTVIEWLEKNPCSNENMMTNEEFSMKINYISLPVKISEEEFQFIQNRFKELSIILNIDDIINFNIDMKLEPYKKLFSIETQRACYDNDNVYQEDSNGGLYDTNVNNNLLINIDVDDEVGEE